MDVPSCLWPTCATVGAPRFRQDLSQILVVMHSQFTSLSTWNNFPEFTALLSSPGAFALKDEPPLISQTEGVLVRAPPLLCLAHVALGRALGRPPRQEAHGQRRGGGGMRLVSGLPLRCVWGGSRREVCAHVFSGAGVEQLSRAEQGNDRYFPAA